jgi:hypothetical protein
MIVIEYDPTCTVCYNTGAQFYCERCGKDCHDDCVEKCIKCWDYFCPSHIDGGICERCWEGKPAWVSS